MTELNPARIVLIKPSALGDIVHTLPVLSALRRRYPTAHITWLVNKGYSSLLEGHPDLDEVLPFDRGAVGKSWRRAFSVYARFFQDLRRRRFDLVIDLQGLLRTGLMCLASGAPRRVGLATAREGAPWFYTDRVALPKSGHLHAIDRYWRVVEALGAGGGPIQFHVPVLEPARHWAEERLHSWPRPWVMIGPGSRWQTKRWPPEHFAALARRTWQRFGGSVILVGGPDEVELSQKVLAQLGGPALDLTGKTTLPQLAAILQRADLMLSNDTGPLHLAVALGRPVVAPYTCTRVALTGPYQAAGSAVETTVWCRGSYLKRCSRLECMNELIPDRLWPLVVEVLQTCPPLPERRSA